MLSRLLSISSFSYILPFWLLLWISNGMENVSGSLATVPLPAISITFYSTASNADEDSLDFLKAAVVQSSAYLNDFFAGYYNSTLRNSNKWYGFSQVDLFLDSSGILSVAEDGEDQSSSSSSSYAYYATVNIGGSALYYKKGEKESHVRSIMKAALDNEDNQQIYMQNYLAQSEDDYFLQGLVAMQVEFFDYSSMPQRSHSSVLKSMAIGVALGLVFVLAVTGGDLLYRRWKVRRQKTSKHHDKSSITNADRKEGLIPSTQANGEARLFA